jgi:hypothetical protein
MGSFIAPFLHTIPFVDIRHLCDTKYSRLRAKTHAVSLTTTADTLLMPGAPRPSVSLFEKGQTAITYRAGDDLVDLMADVTEAPILLHVDLDFFNNRFDWDSDWADRPDCHDPSIEQIRGRIDKLLAGLGPVRERISDTSIGLSPGFFPVEFWQPVYDTLISELASHARPEDTWLA